MPEAAKPVIEWVIPQSPPIDVAAVRAYQGMSFADPTQPQPIYGGYCPTCFPGRDRFLNAAVEAFKGKAFWVTQLPYFAEMIFVNKPGRIVCKCGTHLRFTHPDSEK